MRGGAKGGAWGRGYGVGWGRGIGRRDVGVGGGGVGSEGVQGIS